MNEPDDELVRFLESFVFIYPNISDTFGYACADTEKIYLDGDYDPETEITNQRMLVDIWRRFGHTGLVAYVATMRQQAPVRQLQTEKYEAAMKYIAEANWQYEAD